MNLNEHAIQISQQTSKDRGNCYKALKTLLAKIDNEHIKSLSYNSDFSQVTLNGVDFFQDARKHWKRADVHQQKPVVKTVENKSLTATQVEEIHEADPSIALAASMISTYEETTKPVETPKPFHFDDVLLGPNGRPFLDENGNQFRGKLPPVEHLPDSCTGEPTTIDAKSCVFTADDYKQQLIELYISNGFSERDAEISANAQLNSFATEHDPELTGRYEKVTDDTFLFNGQKVKFNEDELEFQKQESRT